MVRSPLLPCVFLCVSGTAFAQDNIGKAGIVSGNAGVQYERALGDRLSVSGQLGRSTIDTTVNGVESSSSGTGFILEARYYLSSGEPRMEGWHVGTHYNRIATKDERDRSTDIASFGFSTGYQWVFASRLTAEFVVGAGTLDLTSDSPGVEVLGDLGFFPHLGLTVGYGF